MNKVYKVIYSKVKNSYVVVSEIAKNHTKPKSSRTRKIGASLLAASVLSSISASPTYAEWAEYGTYFNNAGWDNATNMRWHAADGGFFSSKRVSMKDQFIVKVDTWVENIVSKYATGNMKEQETAAARLPRWHSILFGYQPGLGAANINTYIWSPEGLMLNTSTNNQDPFADKFYMFQDMDSTDYKPDPTNNPMYAGWRTNLTNAQNPNSTNPDEYISMAYTPKNLTGNVPLDSVIMGAFAGSVANNTVVIGAKAKVLPDYEALNGFQNVNRGGTDALNDNAMAKSVVIGNNATAQRDPMRLNYTLMTNNLKKLV